MSTKLLIGLLLSAGLYAQAPAQGGGTTQPGGGGSGAAFPASGTPCIVNATSITASTCATDVVKTDIANTVTQNGAASAPPLLFNGTWFTGGTATTTKPQVLIEPSGTTSTGWSTAGTGFGINSANGFTGNVLDAQLNGVSIMKMSANTGELTVGNTLATTDHVTLGEFIGSSGFSAIWFNQATPGPNNFSFLGDGTNSYFNAASTAGSLNFRLGNTVFPLTITQSAITYSATIPVRMPNVQGNSSAPSVSVTGSGCALGTPTTGSNNISGKIPVTTGGTCTVTLTWSGSLTYTNGSHCGPLQDGTSGVLAGMASDTTTSVTFSPIVLTTSDGIYYGPCSGR